MNMNLPLGSILLISLLVASASALDTIEDFKPSFFKLSHQNTGIYKIDVGFDEKKDKYWPAEFADLNGDSL